MKGDPMKGLVWKERKCLNIIKSVRDFHIETKTYVKKALDFVNIGKSPHKSVKWVLVQKKNSNRGFK